MEFLAKAIYTLLQSEPFFAHFILNSKIVYDRFGVNTAAASIVDGTPILIFSTKFMGSLSDAACIGVLKHEILHLLLDHTRNRGKDLGDRKLANIAMDCAINQHIDGLPAECISLESIREVCKNNAIEAFQTTEYYYMFLKQAKDKMQKDINQKTLDDHDLDIPGAETNPMQAKAAAEAASSKALGASKGNISEKLSKILNDLRTEPKMNWKQILRNFVASNTTNKTLGTRKKTHRRFELDFPGRKKKRELTLGVCLDSSGSVSEESYTIFINEIAGMIGSVSCIHLVHADCEVQKVEKLVNKKQIKYERHGSGGTAYGPALNACKDLGCNAIVYLGDMDCADIPNNPQVPVLWVTVGSMVKPGEFGKILKLE